MFETILPNGEYSNTSFRDHEDYRDGLKDLSGLAVWTQAAVSIGTADHPELVWGELTSGNYFSVLGVKAILGRVFGAEESGNAQSSHPVAVISERLGRRRFNSDPAVVGKPIRINRRELTVIGVVPGQFRGGSFGLAFDLWVPLTMAHDLGVADRWMLVSRTWRGLFAIGRLKPGVALEQARAEIAVEARRLAAAYPETNQGIGATVLQLPESPTGGQLNTSPADPMTLAAAPILLGAIALAASYLPARRASRVDPIVALRHE